MISSVYGKVHLGYAFVSSNKLTEWKQLAGDALGMHVDEHGPSLMTFRNDAHARRLIIQRGKGEDLTALGWHIDTENALETILKRLNDRGVKVTKTSGEQAALRGVGQFWRFLGPKRQGMELFVDPEQSQAPLQIGISGFLTGASGLGHVAITSRKPETMLKFWQDVFDARISDTIDEKLSGVKLHLTFLRLNERHHSVAIAETLGVRINPIAAKIQHLALQAAELDDVAFAYRRCREMGIKIALSMGQHPNDKEVSFYAKTPSGFELELGWNPITVADDDMSEPASYRGMSLWGHKPQDQTLFDRISQLKTGLASVMRDEYQPY